VTQPIQIEHREESSRGAFVIERDGARIAEMTYSRVGPDQVIIDHTFVHEKLRGHGVARKLLDQAVAWARESGTKVRATCTYAKGQFEQDESLGDVWLK
jgi:predicted GNAT family acetyltransferase